MKTINVEGRVVKGWAIETPGHSIHLDSVARSKKEAVERNYPSDLPVTPSRLEELRKDSEKWAVKVTVIRGWH